ncbi:hypothetical protein O181_040002 [Austropuccinia psidii MF-1]|uniref:F-box domain-containing protein n=1 Tax=Austropuccinia psidii MF-1 TaxID=1389203 RepID=A0A9Q3DDZ4_9BASI|nr:hypothetical protein [Austropuccinia psidii MF-1]
MRLGQQRQAWTDSVLPLCQINSTTRGAMTRRIKAFQRPRDLQHFKLYGSLQAMDKLAIATTFYNNRHLTIFSSEDLTHATWDFINERNDFWESLTFDMYFPHTAASPGLENLDLSNWKNLTSFTCRATSNQRWVDHLIIRSLVTASPKLINLTIFDLDGKSPVVRPEPQVLCKLQSLHLRRLRDCDRHTLRYLVSQSYHSLQELTIVLDCTPRNEIRTQRFYRGIRASQLRAAFSRCTRIRTLRIADHVASMSPPTPFTGEYDPEDGPLGFIVDDMVRDLRRLKNLHTWGHIFSMDLFDNLRMSGCRIKSLSIQSYPNFPLSLFLEELKHNQALKRLESLAFGDVWLPPKNVSAITSLCKERKIKLQFLHHEYQTPNRIY